MIDCENVPRLFLPHRRRALLRIPEINGLFRPHNELALHPNDGFQFVTARPSSMLKEYNNILV